jgi:hypothetical protein
VELEVVALLILAAQRKEAYKVSILRCSIWPGLLTHTILDPIILSDDESVDAVSETDYSDLDVDLTAKSNSDSLHVADSELADGDGFGLGTTHISNHLVADYQANDNNNNNSAVDDAQLRLSTDCPRLASLGHGSVAHQAGKLQVNADITQGSTNYVNLDVTKDVDDDHDDTRSTNCEHDCAQSPRPGLAAASLHQSDLKNDHLPKHLCRRDVTRNVRRKRLRTAAPTGLAGAASTVSAALESTDFEKPHLRALIAAPDQEWEIRDFDQEMVVDDGSTDDSNDEDYGVMSDAAGSKIGGPPRSRKRARQTKDTEDNDVDAPSTHPLDVSYQAIVATSSGSMQESEEIPIYGYFTLKTIASKVAYCLTFSQELLPRPQDRGQRHDCTTDLEEPQSAALATDPNNEWEIHKIIGQKMVGCERYYRVQWKDTWMPESELAGAKELVDAFMANDGSRTGGRKRPLKRGRPAAGLFDAQGGDEPKIRRGRPRKQKQGGIAGMES